MTKFESHELNQKRSSGWAGVSVLRLNPANKRRDFGGIPAETAQKICDPAHELTEEEKSEIRDLLDSQDPYNDQTMRWLIDRILQLGFTSTLIGYWDSKTEEFIVTAGNRRTTAVSIINKIYGGSITRVPVEHENEKDVKKIALRQLVENAGRKDYSDVENAEAIEYCLSIGLTKEEVALARGVSVDTVSRLLNLLILQPEAKEVVRSGLISTDTAVSFAAKAQRETGNPIAASEQATQAIVRLGKEAKETGKRISKSEAKKIQRQAIESQAQTDPNLQAQLSARRSTATEKIEIALSVGLKDDGILPRQVKLLLDGANPDTLRQVVKLLSADESVALDAIEQVAKNLERQVG